MKSKFLVFFRLSLVVTFLFSTEIYGQFLNPDVFNKPYPEIINVTNQPNDFKFTTHMVNIKVPASVANNWSSEVEKQYIQTIFSLIEDKDFVIANYSGFYFPPSSGFTGAHHVNIKNNVENIGTTMYNYSSNYDSSRLLGITRLEEGWFMRPNIITHELMHQWNSHLESAHYWLVDPSGHTGLVEQTTSCFENYRNSFEHVENNIYSYKQYFSGGFVGEFEGYLAGLWDAPSSMRTLKNYYHDSSLAYELMGDYVYVEVFADEIYDIPKAELFSVYGGERNPNYLNSINEYDGVAIVFSLEEFLDDNNFKAYHYASIVNETEDPVSVYNTKYDEVFILQNHPSQNHPDYGRRQLNPYHASFKNLNFNTRLFEGSLNNEDFNLSEEVKIYPNPTRDILNIILSGNSDLNTVSVMTIQGKEIFISNKNKIDLSPFSNGLYFVEIATDKGSITKKIIKQ